MAGLLIGIAAMSLLPAVLTKPALPKERWIAGRILYFAAGRGQMQGAPTPDLYSVRANGTDTRRLTRSRAFEEEAKWSPNGKYIAFIRTWYHRHFSHPRSDLFVMKAGGAGIRRLTRDQASESEPMWSPDGSLVAFVKSSRHGPLRVTSDVFVTGLWDHRTRQLTERGKNYHPSWSPSGNEIAYDSRLHGRYQVRVVRSDASRDRAISVGGHFSYASWSPRSSSIAVLRIGPNCDDGASLSLSLVDREGRSRRLLHHGSECLEGWVKWSPDGSELMYQSRPGGGSDLDRIVDPQTGAQRGLTDEDAWGAVWSPDGHHIAFEDSSVHRFPPPGMNVSDIRDSGMVYFGAGHPLWITVLTTGTWDASLGLGVPVDWRAGRTVPVEGTSFGADA